MSAMGGYFGVFFGGSIITILGKDLNNIKWKINIQNQYGGQFTNSRDGRLFFYQCSI